MLASVVIDADGGRTTYVQTIDSLDAGPFTNAAAIELPGNGTLCSAHGGSFYVGLAEEPTWIRYSLDEGGGVAESGRLSLANLGAGYIDFGNAIVDNETAVSVLSNPAHRGRLEPGHHGDPRRDPAAAPRAPGLRARGADHRGARGPRLRAGALVGLGRRAHLPGRVAHDPRSEGDGDRRGRRGRSLREQRAARVRRRRLRVRDGRRPELLDPDVRERERRHGPRQLPAPHRARRHGLRGQLLLRDPRARRRAAVDHRARDRAPGQRRRLREDVLSGSAAAGRRAHRLRVLERARDKLWRLRLADPPLAEEVSGAPFSAIGFGGSPLDGRLFAGESPDGRRARCSRSIPTPTARARASRWTATSTASTSSQR